MAVIELVDRDIQAKKIDVKKKSANLLLMSSGNWGGIDIAALAKICLLYTSDAADE